MTSTKRTVRLNIAYVAYVNYVVEVSGIEPLTSCMPCKRSPS
jgi:hypothetical protein